MKVSSGLSALLLALFSGGCSTAVDHAFHGGASQAAPSATDEDARIFVGFPDAMRAHTLRNMREHLLALAEIQQALATGRFDSAGDIAEQRLGMSSLALHGAHDVSKFMPQGMQDAGTAMHRSASQFAIVVKDASVTGDLKAPLAALARVSQTCVGCHAAYRIH